MADNTPNPAPGAVPPRPGEAAKVQPKKETVRINLPPKPTAAPTIKIPAPPPAAPAPVAAAAPVAAGPAAAPAPPTPAPKPAGVPPAPTPAPRPASGPRPAPMAAMTSVSGLDKGLAMAAAVIGIAVV